MIPILVSAALAAEPPTVKAAPGQGITVTTADERFQLSLRGRFVLREQVQLTSPDDAGDREVEMLTQIRTARVFLTGYALDPDVKYVMQLAVAAPDYKDGTISPIYDAYLDLTQNPNASVRVGQMFVPFDRARTIREFALEFPERQRPVNELSLDRDVGAYLYSDAFLGEKSILAYRIGAFGGSGINQTNMHPAGGLGVARLELRPFGPFDVDTEGDLERSETPHLAIGVAGAYNLNTTRQKSTMGDYFPDDGTTDYASAEADLVLKWHGVYLLTEALLRNSDIEEVDGLATRSGWGWFVQPGYMLTNHLEIAGRYSQLWPFEGTDPSFTPQHEIGADTNLYLNGHRFKIQAAWIAVYEDTFGDGNNTFYLQSDTMF